MDKSEIIAELQRRLEPSARVTAAIKFTSYTGDRFLDLLPHIECADGFKMSVQASHAHYCTPRDSSGPWKAVEVGYPTAKVEAFMPYIDGENEDPTDTVYGYVPIDTVASVIAEHGGFAKAGAL